MSIPCSAELISTAYQLWNSVFLSQQISHSRLIKKKQPAEQGQCDPTPWPAATASRQRICPGTASLFSITTRWSWCRVGVRSTAPWNLPSLDPGCEMGNRLRSKWPAVRSSSAYALCEIPVDMIDHRCSMKSAAWHDVRLNGEWSCCALARRPLRASLSELRRKSAACATCRPFPLGGGTCRLQVQHDVGRV
jgi:hypothetical protein